jgi:hypothetical protein
MKSLSLLNINVKFTIDFKLNSFIHSFIVVIVCCCLSANFIYLSKICNFEIKKKRKKNGTCLIIFNFI